MLELAGKEVLVIGLGLSGQSAAAFCAERGARVLACDERADLELPDLSADIEVQLGGPLPDPARFDLVVPSPGVPHARYGERARVAWGDVELAFRALPVPVVAVTGTNGKSTTVRLIEAMLTACGFRARAAGNVGDAALGLVGEPLDVAVLEVSSFQLEAVDAFRPRVGVILGCTQDHLDRHGSLERYLATKLRLFARQEADDIAIVNADDERVRAATEQLAARRWLYSTERAVDLGAFVDAGGVRLRTEAGEYALPLEVTDAFAGPLRGNILAALLAASALGAEPAKALAALAHFHGLPHRMERIAERDGVVWIDDSKATNPGAAAAAIAASPGPVIWIAGGRAKGTGFTELNAAPLARVKRLLAIGEAAAELMSELSAALESESCETLERAVDRARELATAGDTVLLAPACASFDQFESFEARGDAFRALVEARS